MVSQVTSGGYRRELQIDDLHHAIRVMRQRAQATQRSHYLIDGRGRVVQSVHPQR